MRLERLDLLRYGHFTDRSVALPRGEADLHVIFGPNEAGKSTSLAAIEDLLFGVPMQSPHNFLHDYSALRIGALLEAEGAQLEVLRRKGNKDTLLDTDDTPLAGGEASLRPFLAGADRSFFERMFSLDHQRLRSGGREILEAKDDIGQMLFAAGSGMAGLRTQLATLAEEADGLWTARRAKDRRFYSVKDKLDAAKRDLHAQTLKADTWQELKRLRDQADAAQQALSDEINEKTRERNRLTRIRRVFRDLRRVQEVQDELAELDEVVELPEDAGRRLKEAEDADSAAEARRTVLQDQLQQAEKSLEGLSFDETLIRHVTEIRKLAKRETVVESEKESLPKREAELAGAEKDLHIHAQELGWPESDTAALSARIPPRGKVRSLRNLLAQRGKLETAAEGHATHLAESRGTLEEKTQELAEVEPVLDVSRLAATIKALREQGDLSGRVRSAGKALKEAEGRVERRLAALNPCVADEDSLTVTPLPTAAEVQSVRDRQRDREQGLRAAKQQLLIHRQERDAARAAVAQRVRDEQLITLEELTEARERRDRLWAAVKVKHLEGAPVPEESAHSLDAQTTDPAAAFEPAVAAADALADRRFEQAEAAGQVAEIMRKIGELETLLAQAGEKEQSLITQGEALARQWSEMWKAAPFQPLAADTMLVWLEDREEVLQAIEARETARLDWTSLNEQERNAKEVLLTELAAISFDIVALQNDDLPFVIEQAADAQAREEAKARRRSELETAVKAAKREVARHERQRAEAEAALASWQDDLRTALAELGLSEATALDTIDPALDLIEDLRKTAEQIRTLRHDRIDKIKKDLADFELAVEELVRSLAPDLQDRPAEAALMELVTRLDEAEELQKRRRATGKTAEELRDRIKALDLEVKERAASLSHLKDLAGVTTAEELKQAIEQSDRKRNLQREAQNIVEHLRDDGDGLSLEDLAAECDGVAFDEIPARIATIDAEVADLRNREREAIEARSQARADFEAIGGDDAAAQAAGEKEEALAEMREVAERYVRVKTSALLLQWAIDRYRREKQAPLLKRAGALFETVTGGSFVGLQVAFDEQDRAELRGLRPEGAEVAIDGMSSGTADQLYLALRVAAIEDYLERAAGLPFVADDLFINFDDARAAAGLRLLQGLSRKTQVLFFTHHRHLVDLAKEALDGAVNLVDLSEQQTSSA